MKRLLMLMGVVVCLFSLSGFSYAVSEYDLPTETSVADDDFVRILIYNGGAWYSAKITVLDLFGSGQLATDNSTASHLLCKDSAGEIENCGGVTISGTTSPIINVNPQEVDGHTHATNLTAAQVSNTVIYNTGQGAGDVILNLPAAAAGYQALFTVGTAQANAWGVKSGANDKIYLIAANGTIEAGDDAATVAMTAAQVGQAFACWTFKTDSYDWECKAIAIGTSTFARVLQ
jgi:hypothetical protein